MAFGREQAAARRLGALARHVSRRRQRPVDMFGKSAAPSPRLGRSARSRIYFFDVVEDYPEIGGVPAVSRRLRRALAERFGKRLVCVRDIAADLGCGDTSEDYLRRERRVIETLAVLDPASTFLIPNFQNPVARRLGQPRPTIVNIVHDLQFVALPDLFTDAQRARLHAVFAETRANADAIAFVSRATRDDFERLFGAPPRAAIIPSPIGATGAAAASKASDPFLLAVQHGGCHPHKNLAGLMRLFAGLAARDPALSLKVAGQGDAAFHKARAALPAPLQARVHHVGYVPRAALVGLYREARAFVSLSRFEGFDMPAVEAAVEGTPLLLSDLPVHRELHGATACFLDPLMPDTDRARAFLAAAAPRRRAAALADACSIPAVARAHADLIEALDATASPRPKARTKPVCAHRSGDRQGPAWLYGLAGAGRPRLVSAMLVGTILSGSMLAGAVHDGAHAQAASCSVKVNASGGAGGATLNNPAGPGGPGGSASGSSLNGGNGSYYNVAPGLGYFTGGGGGGAGGDCVSPNGGTGGQGAFNGGAGGAYGITLSASGAGGTGAMGIGGTNSSGYGGGGGGGGGGLGTGIIGSATLTGDSRGGDGGMGGISGAQSVGGAGGDGGAGTAVFNDKTILTLQAGVASNGGKGGAGGAAEYGGVGGNGGNGGAGVVFTGTGQALLNNGTITGGNGGAGGAIDVSSQGGIYGTAGTAGLGGVGVTGSNLAITNAGTISGGVANAGAVGAAQADAVLFTGGVNSFTITSTSTVNGNVVATGSGNDTFGLGGDTSRAAPFNLAQLGAPNSATAQYQGFGILQKSGASTWAVVGKPSDGVLLAYQVTAGTLIVSNETAASLLLTGGTLAGKLNVNNTTGGFDVQAGTISANLTGSGALTKTTAGTVVLSGTNIYSGATMVNGGTLEVDGSLRSTSLVNAGGTLSGTGVLGITPIAAGGTLSPGSAANPYGTLTVNFFLRFAAGSFYDVAITPTQNSSTNVSGATTIQGGTVNVTPGAGTTYSPTMRYTILTSGGGVTGTFADVTTATPFAFLHPSLSYDANDVYLNIAPANPVVVTNPNTGQPIVNPVTGQPLTVPNYTTAASNQNQLHVAEGLTNAGIVSRGRGHVLQALNQLTVPQAQAAFNSLSGEGLTAAQNIANRSAELFTSSIFDQTTFYGSGNAANSITLTEPVRELADLPTRAAPPVFVQPNRTWRAWAAGFGGVDDIHGNGQIGSAYQQNTIYGGTLGVDYQLMPNYLVGVAIGGTNGDFLVPGRATSGSTTGGHVAVYNLATFGSFYGASSTSFSYFGNRATRTVSGFGGLNTETERANFNSDEFRSRLEFGRHFAGYGGVLTPFVALELAELRSNGFTESSVQGAGLFRLNVSGQSQASAPAFVGLRLQRATSLGNGITLSPTLQVAYVHEFAPYRSQIGTIADLPGSTFLVDGARPARNAAQVKAGAEMAIGANSVIFANFDGELSGVNQLYAGKGGFRYSW